MMSIISIHFSNITSHMPSLTRSTTITPISYPKDVSQCLRVASKNESFWPVFYPPIPPRVFHWFLLLTFRLQGLRSALPECLARVPTDLRILLRLELPPLSVGAQVIIENKG